MNDAATYNRKSNAQRAAKKQLGDGNFEVYATADGQWGFRPYPAAKAPKAAKPAKAAPSPATAAKAADKPKRTRKAKDPAEKKEGKGAMLYRMLLAGPVTVQELCAATGWKQETVMSYVYWHKQPRGVYNALTISRDGDTITAHLT